MDSNWFQNNYETTHPTRCALRLQHRRSRILAEKEDVSNAAAAEMVSRKDFVLDKSSDHVARLET